MKSARGCEHGRLLTTRCRQCEQLADEYEREFDRDVFFGKFDAAGYTPNERIAQQKKRPDDPDLAWTV